MNITKTTLAPGLASGLLALALSASGAGRTIPPPPEGFIGEGQDDDWLAAAFPSDYAAITNKGYEAWLMEDCVGINEQNGRYKVSITVSQLPDVGPCYLVCGPYKVVVTAPGTYSFPLEVFNEYRAYTCPTRVLLSFSYDDGCYIEEDLLVGSSANRSEQSNNPNNRTMLLGSPGVPDYYLVCMTPNVYVVPNHIPLNEAVGTRLRLFCNCPGGTWSYHSSFSEHLRLTFGFPSYAEIRTAEVADRVVILMRAAGHECSGVFYIDLPENPTHRRCCDACCGDSCRCDGSCCLCNCGCHSGGNTSTNTPPDSMSP